ncbi:YrdB family protein [Specibacter cremeus]|uniref:YrdB family protein n=1 Tax=Specibacter cremeus TaxID=1629051 RepID=UPI000F76D09A|nr:YrdB family protein [Specibacter cremeus]
MGRRSAEPAVVPRAVGAATSGAVLTVGFLLEVAMLAAFCFWGFSRDAPWNVVLGIGVPAVVVVLWGLFLAPKASRRLSRALVTVTSLALFLAAALALAVAGHPVLALILAVASVGYAAAVVVLRLESRG